MQYLVCLIRSIALLALVLSLMDRSFAQPPRTTDAEKPIRPVLEEKLGIDSTPFGSVIVFDNRLDTSRFFMAQDGVYPPRQIGFEPSAAVAIERSLEDPAIHVKRGKVPLVISLRQLNIPNLSFRNRPVLKDKKFLGVRLAKAGDTQDYNMRQYLLFTADIFYKVGNNRYRKLFTMRKELVRWGLSIEGSVDYVLRLLLETASISYMRMQGPDLRHDNVLNTELKDRGSYINDSPNRDFTLAEINTNTQTLWSHFPVFKQTGNSIAGRYETFEDFRANNVIPSVVKMQSLKGDSIYQAQPHEKDSLDLSEAWGLFDGTFTYIRIADNYYLKLYRRGDGFYFFVPWSMPDMYALLSQVQPSLSDPHHSGSDNIIVNLGVSAIFAIIEAVQKKGVTNKKEQIIITGLTHDYRYCSVDMDSGDILYSRSPFVQDYIGKDAARPVER